VVKRVALAVLVVCIPACGAVLGVKDLYDPGEEPDAQSPPPPLDAPIESSVDAGCGDIDASAENCGRCNHSCLGGACKSGVCQPIPLATGQGEVWGVALDATYVYFASFTGAFIARVPKAGGKVEPIASSGQTLARRVAVNATHVYWSAGDFPGAIARCPIAGCAGVPETVATPTRPTSVAIDAVNVYWSDRNNSELRLRPLSLDPEAHAADSTAGLPNAVAVDATHLFWIADFTGEVQGRAEDGGTFTVGKDGTSGVDLVLDATNVYWAAAIDVGQDGRIARAPRSGAGPTTRVGSANGEPVSLAVDAKLIAWTSWQRSSDGGVSGGGVYGCAPMGCSGPPSTLASNLDLPRGIALDDQAIYFGVNGAVMKLAR
jgi:hypothetical protein